MGSCYTDVLRAEDIASGRNRRCIFARGNDDEVDVVDLSTLLEGAVLELRKEVPLEIVVSMFQKLASVQLLFSDSMLSICIESSTYTILPRR